MKKLFGVLLLFFLLAGTVYSLERLQVREDTDLQEEDPPIEEPLHYVSQIHKAAKDHNIDPFILAAVARVESSWQEDAESPMGARGLMQIMPETGLYLAHLRGLELSIDDLYDPAVSLDYGAYYLSYLKEKFANWDLVFAAYNAGPGQVEQWLSDQNVSRRGRIITIPFEETRNYVKKVNHYLDYYRKAYEDFPVEDHSQQGE